MMLFLTRFLILHIRSIIFFTFRSSHIFAKCAILQNTNDAKTLVFAFIISFIDHSNAPFQWSTSYSSEQTSLHLKHSCWSPNTHYLQSAHITPLLYQLQCLPISSHIQYRLVFINFKALHGLATFFIFLSLSMLLSHIECCGPLTGDGLLFPTTFPSLSITALLLLPSHLFTQHYY